MDNRVMKNFFRRFKVEMLYGATSKTADEFIHRLKEYINYIGERISLNLNGMSPV